MKALLHLSRISRPLCAAGVFISLCLAVAPLRAAEPARAGPESGESAPDAVPAGLLDGHGRFVHVEPFLTSVAAAGHLKIVAARYDLNPGGFEMLK